jgi:hypothetical protein
MPRVIKEFSHSFTMWMSNTHIAILKAAAMRQSAIEGRKVTASELVRKFIETL